MSHDIKMFLAVATVPSFSQGLLQAIVNKPMPAFSPPSNYKDEEKIKTWLADKEAAWTRDRETEIDADILALAERAETAHVAAVSVCFNGYKPKSFAMTHEDFSDATAFLEGVHSEFAVRDAEIRVLSEFLDFMGRAGDTYGMAPEIVAHDACGSVLPLLRKRMLVLGLPIPAWWPHHARPWDAGVHDTAYMWTGKEARKSEPAIPLEKLLKIFDINPEPVLDKARDLEDFNRRRYDLVAMSSNLEAEALRSVWKRLAQRDTFSAPAPVQHGNHTANLMTEHHVAGEEVPHV